MNIREFFSKHFQNPDLKDFIITKLGEKVPKKKANRIKLIVTHERFNLGLLYDWFIKGAKTI